jgi:hypothetical protein
MMDFLKLLLPIFSPTNYAEMLKKLASFAFYETWLATFFLRTIPEIDQFFHSIENYRALGQALSTIPHYDKLNLFGLALSLAVAGLFYVVQLHDRISDLFGIRKRFDRNYIILPLAVLVGAKLTTKQLNSLNRTRDSLLRLIFYPYVSSKAEHPLVDKHDIERALDAWSWFWVFIEAIPIALLSAITALWFSDKVLALSFCAVAIFSWLTSSALYLRLERFTRPEVEAIAGNATARAKILEAFGAL